MELKKMIAALLSVLLCTGLLAGYSFADAGAEPEKARDPEMIVETDGHVMTEFFSLQMPEGWPDLCQTESYENADTQAKYYVFKSRVCAENNEGGRVASFEMSKVPPEWIEFVPGRGVGTLTSEKTGEMWYLALMYPSDVQFGPDTQEEYMKMYETRDGLADHIEPAEGWSFVPMSYNDMMAEIERTFPGILLEGAMNSMVVKNLNDSGVYWFSYPELDRSRLCPAELGHAYRVTYTGVMGEGYDWNLVARENIDDEYDYSREAAVYVGSLILSVQARSVEGISALCEFPIELDGVTIPDADTLNAMAFDQVIGDNLWRYVYYFDPVEIPADAKSAQVSIVPVYGRVDMERVEDGRWVITGIFNDND